MMHDGEDGLLFPVGDAPALAAAIARVRSEAGLVERLITGGHRTLEASFSQKAVTRAYMELFESQVQA